MSAWAPPPPKTKKIRVRRPPWYFWAGAGAFAAGYLPGLVIPLVYRNYVPNANYVLVKRFSAKEERRRVVASVYDASEFDTATVGFENHLNYFHLNGTGLPVDLARGLALFLNSTAVDQYFRQFSGHTQVNATDLRNLYFPTVQQLVEAGRHFGEALPTQERIDEVVEALL